MKTTYKVIEILDDKSVLIDYGSYHGANENDQVKIISIGPEVVDPETNEVLGTLDSIKAELTIVTAYSKFSLCKKIQVNISNPLVDPLNFQRKTEIIKSLNVNKDSISNKKPPSDFVINVGDKVEII